MEINNEDIVLRMMIREGDAVVRVPLDGVAFEEIERQAVTQALRICGWKQKDAAKLLRISVRVMGYKIKTLGIVMGGHWRSVAGDKSR